MARKVDIITMGCSKNIVDSERVMHMFEQGGYKVSHNPERVTADIVIINTCGFIGDAKQESIDMILQCCDTKRRKRSRKVYVMGCLSQRYAQELPNEITEVDGWFGKFDWKGVYKAATGSEAEATDEQRTLTTGPQHAYLKIAEGCNRFCAFCAIPIITGRYKSRTIENVVAEVRDLVAKGIHEFNVIAQDLTYYGTDIYGKQRIADLVDAIAKVEGVRWIRLHYAYPTDFPYDLLDVMARNDNVCKYLDIALQHINDKVLDNMRRHINAEQTRQLLSRIRQAVPGIHIRTTLMVGFPGEGEAEFAELLDFVREQRFERMGAFAYCEEDDTYAARNFDDNIPQDVKDDRLAQLMVLQEDIALAHNEEKIGKRMQVVIDSENDEYYVGRTQYDSPEVDPEVLVAKTLELKPGDWIEAEITRAYAFELEAVPLRKL